MTCNLSTNPLRDVQPTEATTPFQSCGGHDLAYKTLILRVRIDERSAP
jgi:hypothetical protein